MTTWDGAAEDVAPRRKARQAAVAGQFNQERDMAELQAAEECYRRNDFSGCLAALDPLLKRNPDHIEGHLLLAGALVAQDRCQEAIARLQPLAERHLGSAKLQHKMGLLWDNAGDTHRALEYYRRASKQEPDNKAYRLSYETAAREIAANVPVTALLKMPEEAVAANPHDPQIPISAAVAALQCNEPDVAIALVTRAIRRFPQMAAFYRILATAHYRRGEYAASQTALAQALSLDKSSALSYFLMGCTLTKLGQTAAAAEHFRRAERIDPSFAVRQ
jgi:tetratricopeptide (TPR) repeat protein